MSNRKRSRPHCDCERAALTRGGAALRRLEEKARMKEQALSKSEMLLEEASRSGSGGGGAGRRSERTVQDAMRFDAFLKENDKKAHDALKRCVALGQPGGRAINHACRADRETRLKQEKAAEIKTLSKEISKVEAEMAKYEDRLKAGRQYKQFLVRACRCGGHWTDADATR